jgi:type II secretory pathway pseudopilin PulG
MRSGDVVRGALRAASARRHPGRAGPACLHGLASQGGFTYLGVLFLVAAFGLALAAAAEVWSTTAKREREAELLFAGVQIRQAIEAYRNANPNVGDGFPKELDWLLQDPHQPDVRRYLRRIYIDPMTGRKEWGLVQTPSGTIIGVHSLSESTPIKTAGFPADVTIAKDAKKYSDWVFAVSTSVLAPPPGTQPGTQPGQPLTPVPGAPQQVPVPGGPQPMVAPGQDQGSGVPSANPALPGPTPMR